RRLVGRDRVGAGAVMRDRIGARQAARRHVSFLIWPLWPQAVSAGIAGAFEIDAENMAEPISVSRDPIVMLAGMGAGQQMFVTIFDPAYRMVELQRQCGKDNLFGIKPRLGSKS